MPHRTPTDEPAPEPRPSKTQRKHDAHRLQELGQALLALPDERLAALAMPEALLEAVRELRRIRAHEARRRQLQYVGKLMRGVDTEPLREAVAAFELGRAHDALALHRAERWREALVADDDALTRWLERHPDADAQRLRSLVRAARKDAALPPEQRHGRAWRELFRFIKQDMTAHD